MWRGIFVVFTCVANQSSSIMIPVVHCCSGCARNSGRLPKTGWGILWQASVTPLLESWPNACSFQRSVSMSGTGRLPLPLPSPTTRFWMMMKLQSDKASFLKPMPPVNRHCFVTFQRTMVQPWQRQSKRFKMNWWKSLLRKLQRRMTMMTVKLPQAGSFHVPSSNSVIHLNIHHQGPRAQGYVMNRRVHHRPKIINRNQSHKQWWAWWTLTWSSLIDCIALQSVSCLFDFG